MSRAGGALALALPQLSFTPQLFFAVVVTVSIGAAVGWSVWRLWRGRAIAAVAREYDLRYTVLDRFDLSRRVAPLVPVIGAADVHAQHVCYALQPGAVDKPEHRLYVMTVAYTIGTLSRPLQRRGVIAAREHPQSGRLTLALPTLLPSGPESYRRCMESLLGAGVKVPALTTG